MRRSGSKGTVQCGALLLLVLAARAQADERPIPLLGTRFLLVGVSVGGEKLDHRGGVLGGLELSLVHFPLQNRMKPELSHRWWGGYLDVVHDFSQGVTRASIGPELGFALVGVDGGLAVQGGHGRTDVGATVRGLFTWGFFAAYGRVGVLAPSRALVGGRHDAQAPDLVALVSARSGGMIPRWRIPPASSTRRCATGCKSCSCTWKTRSTR